MFICCDFVRVYEIYFHFSLLIILGKLQKILKLEIPQLMKLYVKNAFKTMTTSYFLKY